MLRLVGKDSTRFVVGRFM